MLGRVAAERSSHFIDFRDSPVWPPGRYIQGSSLAVWVIMLIARGTLTGKAL
jgi:hypothetical protein